MDYGAIIKRSWQITWRYKALWLLGLFAGISGCQGGGSSPGGSNTSFGTSTSGGPEGLDFPNIDPEALFMRLLPALIAASIVLFLLWLLWSVLSLAARGGLVVAVNEIEEGRQPALGQMWGRGFSRFWSLVGLGLLLNLPVAVVFALMMLAIFVPLFGSLAGGGEPGAELLAPICGSVLVGVPVLFVLSLVLGVLYLLSLRYVMLGELGVIDAIKTSWKFFRIRFKDTALMYLINAGLNIVASFVLAIPAIAIGFAIAVPIIAAIAGNEWRLIVAPIILGVLAIVALSWLYTAIWGTYTSALWTLFFRRVMGVGVPATVTPAGPMPPAPPAAPYAPAPPAAPQSPPPAPLAPPGPSPAGDGPQSEQERS